ncbi:Holliday junction DNA helicase subunit RuvA [Magnetococcus marinus MC-1]|uniref:Holliday junction branch migration complex subunit RuvA n=1 Tax=Magnetococcus marinus (strain ATCC BAA-1437 / JCM 17883 / MC-1) TaxID=156889 RepID=RUVA_MAGMM|nr:Holliday junction branch migration protein RuvA [Magnetococcus marinus]A0L4V9.1 RecName: Full=Holliday junction branch migration complex subunit RuvA [Magnetococcus marinus MC-1]ABK43002.1 Holliday junction DNA helicase subunit RuvA [Magnetococcus marinus MC-1]
MIAQLKGSLAAKHPDHVVMDVHGVGYRVFISLATYNELPTVGEACLLYTVTHVREDAFLLYGFHSESQRKVFNLLTSVNGIGTKLALAALSSHTPEALLTALSREDLTLLCTIPGVGKKTAQRMAMELKDKLGALPMAAPTTAIGAATMAANPAGLREEVASALLNLGYKPPQVDAALAKLFSAGEITDISVALKGALKLLAPA